ncbi:protein ELYS [Anopheles cruzii]|uniref:protein ELYS n=1 Tax=Anopheles cruzii TaxID=68878 RepID=UPI0022EC20EF|nr:protein ELYS [Anopheles cruzii]
MTSDNICLELVDTVRYSREAGVAGSFPTEEDNSGILERNGLAWYARGAVLEVFNINPGFKVISHNFVGYGSKPKTCTIECVEEVFFSRPTVLAVALRLGLDQCQIVFLSLHRCRELGRIDIQESVKTVRWIDNRLEDVGALGHFSCCLALGTEDGKVLLVDGCLRLVGHDTASSTLIPMHHEAKRQCHIELFRSDLEKVVHRLQQVRDRGLYVGLQLLQEVQGAIECMLQIVSLKLFMVGFEDGTVLLYDLPTLSVVHRIDAPKLGCSALAMNFIEPSDDPKPCLYVWVFYAHAEGAFAVLYLLMYQNRDRPEGLTTEYYQPSERLRLKSSDPGSLPLNVQTIAKKIAQEDEPITLSVLSWLGSDNTTTVLVFDLNQWYKAEMPFECDWQQDLTHMVVFQLQEPSFHVQLIERSLVLFRSIQRPEEHFYPSSLAFDISSFHGLARTQHRWVGLQNKLLQYLDQDGANVVIEPAGLYQMLCRAALVPQFYEQLPAPDDDVREVREFVLSLGLEYNCNTFLQSCIDLWADGSHLGANPERGVSLSTLTDWIWNRSKTLKGVCNRMLTPLLEAATSRIDTRTQDAIAHCTRELKQLSELYRTILTDCLPCIPENVLGRLSKESDSIRAASEYQSVLQWLLYIYVLPEGPESSSLPSDEESDEANSHSFGHFSLLPYPYRTLVEFYGSQRRMLNGDEDETSCEFLFIDNLLEREFDRAAVRKVWLDGGTQDGETIPLYPPQSLQKALRILLLPEVPLERKLALFLYLFMDIVTVLGDGRYRNILQRLERFPNVFNLKLGVMRRVQAFWHLDHGNMACTVEEFLSPLSSTVDFPQWHRELIVSVLLRLDAPHLALKVLRAPGCPVTPRLELLTLVQNNLISEAFSLQRRTPQPDGQQLVWFVEAIMQVGKPETMLEFSLTDEEKRVLREYLHESPLAGAGDVLMLGHLLQNFEFVEAVQLVDRLSRKRSVSLETQREILALYHKALDPTSQRLAYLTYSEPKELEPRFPTSPTTSPNGDGEERAAAANTLSSALIRSRADFRVRVMHRSIVAIKEAAALTGLQHDRPFLEKPGLGVFQCRPMVRSRNVAYPVRLDPSMNKRRQRDISFEEFAGTDHRNPLFNEEDGQGIPRKRRCLGPESTGGRRYVNFDVPVPTIPEFKPMKPKFNFTATAIDAASGTGSDRTSKSTSHSPSIFLTTPPVSRKFLRPGDRSDSPVFENSYTPPHGILKAIHSDQSASSAHLNDGEEKVLRFELPTGGVVDSTPAEGHKPSNTSPTPVAMRDETTPTVAHLERPDLNLSGVSNDDFYSPEVTMENSSLQQVLYAGGPTRRRPLHYASRSDTPTAAQADEASRENNIAIIIEDHLEDDDSSKGDEQREEDEEPMELEMEEEEARESGESPIREQETHEERIDLAEPEQPSENAAETEEEIEDEIILLDNDVESIRSGEDQNVVDNECMETSSSEVLAPSSDNQEPSPEVLELPASDSSDEEEDGSVSEIVLDDVDEETDAEYAEDGDDYSDGEEEDDDADQGEDEDDDDYGDDDDDGNGDAKVYEKGHSIDPASSDDSVLEVIDVSDEATSPSRSSGSSSSGSSGPQDQPDEQPVLEPFVDPADEPASGSEMQRYEEFYSESVPQALFDEVELVEEQNDGDGQATDYIQVPTTSSSTHRTEQEAADGPPIRRTVDGAEESPEVEDLSVQQQDSDPVYIFSAPTAARDFSVAGEQWDDGVASTSGLSEARLAAPVTPATSSPPSATTTASVTAPAQTHEEKENQFGQPKNAHELEVPAINLSVKPDEAHGSSRKNSKGEENGLLTEESRALNLSADQQELAAQLRAAEAVSKSASDDNDREKAAASDDSSKETDGTEAHSSSEGTTEETRQSLEEAGTDSEPKVQSHESEEMEIELPVSGDQGGGAQAEVQAETSGGDSEQRQHEEEPSKEHDKTEAGEQPDAGEELKETQQELMAKPGPKARHQELALQDQSTPSTSSPRPNVKTRFMLAMEKSATAQDEPSTPTRRRSVRASSVMVEASNTPLTPTLSRNRRYSSMDNVSGTPEAPLTPRRSTRASSMAKELFGTDGTPQKMVRRPSQSSVDTEQRSSLPNSPDDSIMEPPEPSERSFASSTASSTRRSTRVRKLRAGTTVSQPEFESSERSQSGTPLLADYSSNRRLTRHQLAVMEKSLEIASSASTSAVRTRRTSSRATEPDETVTGNDSEPESIVSNVSGTSARSTRSRTARAVPAARRTSIETRSSRAGSRGRAGSTTGSTQQLHDPSEQDSDESDRSIAGYAGSQRALAPIAEEGTETSGTEGSRKRARGRKAPKGGDK